jgi:predicted O-methyltransferase YrrM
MSALSQTRPPETKSVCTFVPVIQRRQLQVEASLLPLIEPLFLIPTHMTFEERLLLLRAALSLPRGFVACEVGSYLGASACFLATAALRLDGHLHCVDTWRSDAMPGEPPEDTFARFCENTHHFRHFLTLHRGTAAERAPGVAGPLDLLFIDGDHSTAAVTDDLTRYVPKLKPGGLLALHDYTFATVRKASDAYFAGRPPIDKGGIHSLKLFQMPG